MALEKFKSKDRKLSTKAMINRAPDLSESEVEALKIQVNHKLEWKCPLGLKLIPFIISKYVFKGSF